MFTLVSEMGVYEFFKDRLHFIESDAKKYAGRLSAAERKLHSQINEKIESEIRMKNYVTKQDFLATTNDLQNSMVKIEHSLIQLENRIEARFYQFESRFYQFEARMEKSNRDMVLLVVTILTGIIGLAVAVIKIF